MFGTKTDPCPIHTELMMKSKDEVGRKVYESWKKRVNENAAKVDRSYRIMKAAAEYRRLDEYEASVTGGTSVTKNE